MKYEQKPILAISGAHETSHCGTDALDAARNLGISVARAGAVLAVGATTGIPLWAAKGALDNGGTVLAFSPAANAREHRDIYHLPDMPSTAMIYTGFGLAGCDVMMMRAAHGVLIGCGRIGTIHEFTTAFQEGKPIGVMQGAWDTDELLRDIISQDLNRKHDTLFFDTDPHRLVDEVLGYIRKHAIGEEK
jgi:uncharacterized protein (TIGR00725 family)